MDALRGCFKYMDLQMMTDICLFIFCKLTLQLLSSSALTVKNNQGNHEFVYQIHKASIYNKLKKNQVHFSYQSHSL